MRVTILRMALGGLRRAGVRTVLSMVAVAIGIAAVIATAALGAGAAARVEQQIAAVGEDFLWIRAGSRNVAGVRTGSGGAQTLTEDDARALAAEVPSITMCSPRASGRQQIIMGGRNWNTQYRGVSADFFEIRNREVQAGTVFNQVDESERAQVLVLGPAVADRLFPEGGAVGATVRVARALFRVIGVLESKGASRGGLDRDDAIFVPLSTVRRTFNRTERIDDIMCAVSPPAAMDMAEQDAANLLRARHDLDPEELDDFEIQQPVEAVQLRAATSRTLASLLIAMGAVSLVVGGVGIMNIMLVAVTERRREIGIRLAIGARMRDVRRQFLLEAAAIGAGGAVLGAAAGVLLSRALADSLGTTAVVSPTLVALVALAGVVTGLVFGYLPAHQASALDPLEAIRSED